MFPGFMLVAQPWPNMYGTLAPTGPAAHPTHPSAAAATSGRKKVPALGPPYATLCHPIAVDNEVSDYRKA
jgi:hypothetical protein